MSDLITVIVPNYKRVEELRRSLESVVSQSYKNLEVIIIDDCSPNILEIEKVVDTFNDDRISLIKSETNKGGGAARNLGILAAQGRFIAFLDSDDIWHKEKLQKQYECASDYDEVFIYNQSEVLSDMNTSILPKRGKFLDEKVTDYLFVNEGFIQTSSFFISAKSAKACLIDETLPRHQDYDFIFKVESLGIPIVFLEEALTTVFWNSGESPVKKGWSPDLSIRFLEKNRSFFTQKSYNNFYFKNIIYSAGLFSSKKQSFILFLKNLNIIKYVGVKEVAKYLLRLLLDWRFIGTK